MTYELNGRTVAYIQSKMLRVEDLDGLKNAALASVRL